MSLVNDMLRDLNKRTPVSNKAARVHGAIHSSIESKRPKVRVGLILAGGLLAGVLAGYVYFQSMGVQVVQVPLATVPFQPATPAPAVPQATLETQSAISAPAAESTVSADAVAPAGADTPAIEHIVQIREQALQPEGFTLIIESAQDTTFEIRDRTAVGLIVHLAGVDSYDRAGTTLPGMSLMLVNDGLDIGIELNEPADFLVRYDTETANSDILLTATYRREGFLSDSPAINQPDPIIASLDPIVPQSNVATPAPQSQTGTAGASEQRSAGRVNRELSLEDRDRNNSQAALVLAQNGRMAEAYGQLLKFIEENPAGHESRGTLAKLLFAQQQYEEAGSLIDQGLAQVPNYSAFKKIKARLLMQADQSAEALTLLRTEPPPVTSDNEYHELLASLYQKGNQHEQAVATYQQLLRSDREQGRWWTGLGISLEALKMDSDALASYQTALQTRGLDNSLRQYIQNRISNLSPQ